MHSHVHAPNQQVSDLPPVGPSNMHSQKSLLQLLLRS
jgi:hypothetical protein